MNCLHCNSSNGRPLIPFFAAALSFTAQNDKRIYQPRESKESKKKNEYRHILA
jgi:hypothetical protein